MESYIAVPLIRRDGSFFGTLCALDPLPSSLTESDLEIFVLLSNLIAFELEAEEQQHRRELEMRSMEDFIAMAAHDLRQPLTVLNGRAQLLARQVRRAAPQEVLSKGIDEVVAQARRAVQMSDTLLDIARIHMGNLSLDEEEFDVVALAHQVLADVKTVAPQHTFELVAPLSVLLCGDERRLGQVLQNLLDNAAKYAPADRGPVVLSIEEVELGDGKSKVCISVRDHGPGVAADELPHLFERQYRTPSAEESSAKGSGLGLYIACQVMEAHHGKIWAENASTGGLIVHIMLPKTPSQQ
jgi:sigma-B regulation protein RsbU (phosphoserine phosphatase)